jgi:hypothetical protein
VKLRRILEGLEQEGVDAAGEKPVDLAPEVGPGLVHAGGTPGLDPNPQGAHGTQHPGPGAVGARRGGPGELRPRAVDGLGVGLEPEGRELHGVCTEGVGLDELGPGRHVGAVHLGHSPGSVRQSSS